MSLSQCLPRAVLLAVMSTGVIWGQGKPSSQPPLEFPVTMRQNVVAGKTPVGTKVEANLTLATLVSGKVIPSGATFSGEIVESTAKTATSPSRLAIRMDSAHWKNGSVTVRAYLTAWYYPILISTDLQPDPAPDIHGDITTGRHSRSANSTTPFPDASGRTDMPTSAVSEHRVLMKEVDSTKLEGGGFVLTSTHLNLKLDRTNTYVLATGELGGVGK